MAVDLRISGVATDTVGMLGESLGLKWGGRFSKPDPGHFELLTNGAPDAGSDAGDGGDSLFIYGGDPSPVDASSAYDVSADDPEASSIFPYLLLGLAALIVIEVVW